MHRDLSGNIPTFLKTICFFSSICSESAFQEDLTFGSYQPSLGPKLRGQQPSRSSLRCETSTVHLWFLVYYLKFICFSRKSNLNVILCIRFSSEEPNIAFQEKKPKSTSSSRDRRASDWLGLKSDDDFLAADATNTKTPAESPLLDGRPSPTDKHVTSAEAVEPSSPTDEAVNGNKQQASKSQLKEEDKDDWLTGVLRRKVASEAPLLERTPPSADSHTGSAPTADPSLAQTENIATEVELEASKNQHEEQEEDDWLAAALRRKSRFKAGDSGLRQEQESTVRWCGLTTVLQVLVCLLRLIAFSDFTVKNLFQPLPGAGGTLFHLLKTQGKSTVV